MHKSLDLTDARERTPPVNPVEAMRRQLALAMFDGVRESDIGTMMTKLKEMALRGDLKAMALFLKLVTSAGEKAAPAPTQAAESAAIKSLADAIQDLVDEVRITKAGETKKTKLLNGQSQKGDSKHAETDPD